VKTGSNGTIMFDNIYLDFFPLIGFVVYLKPRYRLETVFLLGTGLLIFWLMSRCGVRNLLFVHSSAILVEALYLLFVWHVVLGRSRVFISVVPFRVWIAGVATVTAFATGVTAYIYIHGLAECQ